MKNILLLITIILTVSFSVFAQSNSDWKIFTPANEEFSLEAPESFALTRFPSPTRDSPRLYKAISKGTYFLISSGKNDSLNLTQFPFSLAGEIKSFTETTIDNLQGRKSGFADTEGFYQEILIISSKKRIYVFHTLSETKDDPAVERFFSSLRFNTSLPESNKLAEETARQNDSSQNQENSKLKMSSVSGNGNGIGLGNGTGGISPGQTNPPTSDNQTSGLKILSKPKAVYTDAARFYGISGNVQVRVTFMANGEIGNITPVTKLPFGLTTSAVNAARNLRFEPAKREGTPYSTTKLVIYTFTIY